MKSIRRTSSLILILLAGLALIFQPARAQSDGPLAIVMTGGLVTSTLFTLLVLPTLYLWLGGARGAAVAGPPD